MPTAAAPSRLTARSSTNRHRSGSSPISAAASRNASGSGFSTPSLAASTTWSNPASSGNRPGQSGPNQWAMSLVKATSRTRPARVAMAPLTSPRTREQARHNAPTSRSGRRSASRAQ